MGLPYDLSAGTLVDFEAPLLDMPKQSVDLPIALAAISDDLDALGDEIATIAGQQAQHSEDLRELRGEVRGVGHKLDTLIDLVRMKILPGVDEVDAFRHRIVKLEDAQARSRSRELDAE